MKNAYYATWLEQSPELYRLRLSGSLTIQQAADIQQYLSEGLAHSQHLAVELDQPAELDLTFVQLLKAGQLTAEKRHKKLSVSAQLPEELDVLLQKAGISLTL